MECVRSMCCCKIGDNLFVLLINKCKFAVLNLKIDKI